MSKGNVIYNVVIYIGSMMSHDTRVIYTTSKESQAERFLHTYCKNHPEVNKAYIERQYGTREDRRNEKRRYEDED